MISRKLRTLICAGILAFPGAGLVQAADGIPIFPPPGDFVANELLWPSNKDAVCGWVYHLNCPDGVCGGAYWCECTFKCPKGYIAKVFSCDAISAIPPDTWPTNACRLPDNSPPPAPVPPAPAPLRPWA